MCDPAMEEAAVAACTTLNEAEARHFLDHGYVIVEGAFPRAIADEVRESDLYFQDIKDLKADEDQLDLAKELIKRKTKPFDPERFEDHYQVALKDLVKAKIEKRPPDEPDEAPRRTGNVVNLMDALKRSLKSDESGGTDKAKPAARSKKSDDEPETTKKTAGAKKPAAKKAAPKKAATKSTAKKTETDAAPRKRKSA